MSLSSSLPAELHHDFVVRNLDRLYGAEQRLILGLAISQSLVNGFTNRLAIALTSCQPPKPGPISLEIKVLDLELPTFCRQPSCELPVEIPAADPRHQRQLSHKGHRALAFGPHPVARAPKS